MQHEMAMVFAGLAAFGFAGTIWAIFKGKFDEDTEPRIETWLPWHKHPNRVKKHSILTDEWEPSRPAAVETRDLIRPQNVHDKIADRVALVIISAVFTFTTLAILAIFIR